ncbi:aldo/keto reductase [uncultured Fibrella sp.]|uniref:aldo/keto reductase n=1 Tax=uncultured Fibrella sp. TaxID=1284596 RepID=UPI0035C99E03
MKTVELASGIHSSALGFGCAPILGSVDRSVAVRAINVAIDCGINHFDLARSYGYGEAEGFIGKVIKGRRQQFIIASKFGIQANWKAKLFRPIKPIVRAVRDNIFKRYYSENSLSLNISHSIADRFHDRVPLSGVMMRASLERTLSALKSEYLDYFFIHEPPGVLVHLDDLMTVADKLKSEGKIRAWGLAYNRSNESIHRLYLTQFDLLQFNISPGVLDYSIVVDERGNKPNILFSPLKGGGLMKPADKLKTLSEDFSKSVILCSMFNEKHIKENSLLFD